MTKAEMEKAVDVVADDLARRPFIRGLDKPIYRWIAQCAIETLQAEGYTVTPKSDASADAKGEK